MEEVLQAETAIAPANLAQQEEERIPRVIVTTYVPRAIAISNVRAHLGVRRCGGKVRKQIIKTTINLIQYLTISASSEIALVLLSVLRFKHSSCVTISGSGC